MSKLCWIGKSNLLIGISLILFNIALIAGCVILSVEIATYLQLSLLSRLMLGFLFGLTISKLWITCATLAYKSFKAAYKQLVLKVFEV